MVSTPQSISRLTPAVIRDIVARAIAKGWDPEKSEPFALEYALIRDKV